MKRNYTFIPLLLLLIVAIVACSNNSSKSAADSDMEDTARQVISIVCRQLPLFSGVSITPDIARVTDNSKVTDHHAILPTVQLEKQDVSALPQSEQKILNLIGMRLLCATGEKHTYAETQITLSCEGYAFKDKGKTCLLYTSYGGSDRQRDNAEGIHLAPDGSVYRSQARFASGWNALAEHFGHLRRKGQSGRLC